MKVSITKKQKNKIHATTDVFFFVIEPFTQCTDIYQGLKIFANGCVCVCVSIYIYIYIYISIYSSLRLPCLRKEDNYSCMYHRGEKRDRERDSGCTTHLLIGESSRNGELVNGELR